MSAKGKSPIAIVLWICDIIQSCKTMDQLATARRLAKQFYNQYVTKCQEYEFDECIQVLANHFDRQTSFLENEILPGDLVNYIDTVNVGGTKKEKVLIEGIWDGKQAVFSDKDKTIVRNKEWLLKVKTCSKCGRPL